MASDKEISVIIPAYNEEAAIETVVGGIIKQLPEVEVIVVNDGSTDSTALYAAQAGAMVINHEQRKGYGASIKTGLRATEAPYVLICDADGQHLPEDLILLIKECKNYDMVVGKRDKDAHAPLMRRPGRTILAAFTDFLVGFKIPDFNSGLRIFKKDVLLRYLHLMPDGFSFSATSTLAMIKSNRSIAYVPIRVYKRKGKSMVVPWKDGPNILLLMLRLAVLFDPLKVFLPVSGLLFLIGVISFTLDISAAKRIDFGNATVILFVSSLVVFMFGLLCDQISAMRREKHE